MKKKSWYIIFLLAVASITSFLIIGREQVAFDPIPGEAVAPNLSPFSEYEKAVVVSIESESHDNFETIQRYIQEVKVRFLSGQNKNQEVNLSYEVGTEQQKLRIGSKIVVAKSSFEENVSGYEFVIVDEYRLPYLAIFILLFVVLAIIFGRWRAVTSIVGLLFSLVVLLYFLAPRILSGSNPTELALAACVIIAIVSLYIAHGFNRRTSLSVISTLIIIFTAFCFSLLAIKFLRLFGNGSEEILLLQSYSLGALNLQGLLLAGILIGTLGILDDITTAQTAAVEELSKANQSFSLSELYKSAMSIGREHIASLINTLVLAYAGAFFPLFLIIIINFHQPFWTILNSEFIIEEVVRALVGSIALVLAVPLSSLLASYYYSRKK